MLGPQKDGKSPEKVSVTLHDLRDALLAELRLFRLAVCGPLIQRVLKSRVPLVSDSIPSTSAHKVADLVSDWRKIAAGSEPIDQSVAREILSSSLKVIAGACATTDSIVSGLTA